MEKPQLPQEGRMGVVEARRKTRDALILVMSCDLVNSLLWGSLMCIEEASNQPLEE